MKNKKLQEIKTKAKEKQLENKKVFGIAGLLYVAIPVAGAFIPRPQISVFIMFLAYLYFSLVLTKMAIKCTRTNDNLVKSDIYDVSGGKGFVLFALWRLLFIFICFIPALCASLFLLVPTSRMEVILALIATIALMFLGGFFATSIAPSPFLCIEKPDAKARDILYTSRIYMKGKKKEYYQLMLGYLPWMLLSIVTVGIAGMIWVPRMMVARAEYYKTIGKSEIITNKKKKSKGIFEEMKEKRENLARFGRRGIDDDKQ